MCHGQLYQRRMTQAYNKKVLSRNFEVGQLVLRRILPHQVEAKGKFSPNWQRPFVVKKVLPNGALYLTDIEGKMAKMAINADAVKRYYDDILSFVDFIACLVLTFLKIDMMKANIVSSFVYPFELSFIFLSYPSFGIKIESKINVRKIRAKKRVRKLKKKRKKIKSKQRTS